jgi:hypothetical protein
MRQSVGCNARCTGHRSVLEDQRAPLYGAAAIGYFVLGLVKRYGQHCSAPEGVGLMLAIGAALRPTAPPPASTPNLEPLEIL